MLVLNISAEFGPAAIFIVGAMGMYTDKDWTPGARSF